MSKIMGWTVEYPKKIRSITSAPNMKTECGSLVVAEGKGCIWGEEYR